MKSACTRGSRAYDVCQKRLDMHIASQRVHRELYYANRFLLEKEPEKYVTIIHDKIDQSKTSSLHFSHKSKHMDLFMKLPIYVAKMIVHGHGNVRYIRYGLDIFPSDSNHTMGSIAKLLRDLELPPKHSSCELFQEIEQHRCLRRCLLGPKCAHHPCLPNKFQRSHFLQC